MLDYTTNIARFTPLGFDLSDKYTLDLGSANVSSTSARSDISLKGKGCLIYTRRTEHLRQSLAKFMYVTR
jgi:hypothetical protein